MAGLYLFVGCMCTPYILRFADLRTILVHIVHGWYLLEMLFIGNAFILFHDGSDVVHCSSMWTRSVFDLALYKDCTLLTL